MTRCLLIALLTLSGASLQKAEADDHSPPRPFTAATNFMSLRGYLRYRYMSWTGEWWNIPPLNERLNVGAHNPLRFDGLYYFPRIQYLRFCPDGTVLSVPTPGSPAQVIRWLKPGMGRAEGKYLIADGKILFTTTGQEGSVTWMGTITGETLDLHLHSFINGYEGKEQYHFVPVSE